MAYERVIIGDVAFGGDGVGRLPDGAVIFVPFTALGDDVTVEVTARNSSFCRGEIAELNHAGEGREIPKCRLYGKCGGCVYQHVNYDTEIDYKQRQFKDLLKRIGKLQDVPEPVVVKSPQHYGYRNKLRLEPFDRTLTDNGYRLSYGYCDRDNQTYHIVKRCPLAQDALNDALTKAIHSDWGKQNARRSEPYTMTLRISSQNELGFYFGKPSPKLPWFHEDLAGFQYRVPTGSFWQVNPPVAETLLYTVKSWLAEENAEKPELFLDAYGGVGTFMLALGKQAHQRALIECDAAAVAAADMNCENAGQPAKIIEGTTEGALQRALSLAESPEDTVVVLDPPRTGCVQSVIEQLRKARVRTIVYVSCNVATLARDLRLLCAGNLYVIRHTGVFDMFPRTAHFESAVLLQLGER